ncbi:MerR family transcriptional regulator [Streptomyces sp. NBC_00859]|uniref:helix-turn-helix domain-containing protein n=1 Tax=Streptomyces sp. NBC_00859 TaxID=2903682 RepID=UPI003868919F|nr:MerR family transcriptional regulator [Streptomyces sp. NBC_00859]
MDDDTPEVLTIGQLSRRTGLPVRTIRYWSDSGALPPAGRSAGGYRLYDAACVARLELVRTLRELGLGLAPVRRVLSGESGIADVAATHVAALDAQIRSLRLNRAVLSTIAKRASGAEETALMNRLARLSAAERGYIIEEFTDEVFGGLDAAPGIRRRVRALAVELPDDPTPEQVDAWVELAELVQDPAFRQRMRAMAEFNTGAAEQGGGGPGARSRGAGAQPWFAEQVTRLAGDARESGIAPGSPEAAGVLDQLFATGADRGAVLMRLEGAAFAEADRYRQLMAVINGREPQPRHNEDFAWLAAALRAHPVGLI